MRISLRRWDGTDPDGLARELRSAVPEPEGITAAVAATIAAVRDRGDAALLELGESFDGVAPESLELDEGALAAAAERIPAALREALELAAANIETVARAQLGAPPDAPQLPEGQSVTIAEVPVGAAAIYAPGGRSAYPSSVLMGVIPAVVAGVERVVVASPPQPDGRPAPSVLAAAYVGGASAAYAVGGAQAIAALAYGTESVPAVDVIAGPGSPWVQEAKLQVGRVAGIDGYAGPSELMVICDGSANLPWLALDLCAQAEHGEDGMLVAASPDPNALRQLGTAVEELAPSRPSAADVRLELVEAPDLEAAASLANGIAPEHLQLDCSGAEDLSGRIRTAGCLFVGAFGATAFGDYAAGSNHILPTGGAGRFTGPLGPATFRRRIARVELDQGSATRLAPTVDEIARSEGFPVHGESARARGEANGPPEQAS